MGLEYQVFGAESGVGGCEGGGYFFIVVYSGKFKKRARRVLGAGEIRPFENFPTPLPFAPWFQRTDASHRAEHPSPFPSQKWMQICTFVAIFHPGEGERVRPLRAAANPQNSFASVLLLHFKSSK
jgi:hypothetical protein